MHTLLGSNSEDELNLEDVEFGKKLTLTQDDWDTVLDKAVCTTYQKDEEIVRQGAAHQRVYQISTGKVRVEKTDKDGNQTILGYLSELEMFGVSDFIEGLARASVIADENDVEVFYVEADRLEHLMATRQGFGGRFYKFICLQLLGYIQQFELEEALRAKTGRAPDFSDISSLPQGHAS